MSGALRSNCTIHLRVTNPALRSLSLKGVIWCRWLDLHQLPAHYQCAAHLDVLQRRNGTHGVSRTLATRLRRAGADFRRRGYELAPVSGVEPLRSAFVARSPKSLGPRAMKWMWRVDLHHHRQVYETCAPLFVLRHRRWCPEKCSHLRLFLFREALELSQLSRRNWYARPELNWHA